MESASEYTFDTESEPLLSDPVLIVGVQWSGTTLLGNIVGSLEGVEYEYEPWLWGNLPILVRANLLPASTAATLLRGYTGELISNHILGRNVNLRSTDSSCKTNFVSEGELRKRWQTIEDREGVKAYVLRNRITLVFKMVNFQPFLPLFFDAFPNGRVVHIIRNPFDAALSADRKRWFSDAVLTQSESADVRKSIATRKGKRYLPWWVPETDVDRFVSYSGYERALWCFRILMQDLLELRQNAGLLTGRNYFEMKYESLLLSPKESVGQLATFLGRRQTERTREMVNSIDGNNIYRNREYHLEHLSDEDKEEICRLMFAFEYNVAAFLGHVEGESEDWVQSLTSAS